MVTNERPFRGELLSLDSLQRHARILAADHPLGDRPGTDRLITRLTLNERILRDYNASTRLVEGARSITPASEWLLDNSYLVEEQIRMARRHLPRGFCRELPVLASGPHQDLPRVYDLGVTLISHVDGRIDAPHLIGFIAAYQEVSPLTLGELWAIPIMLRLGLIENLRRVAVLLSEARLDRDDADKWAERMLGIVESRPAQIIVAVGNLARSRRILSPAFVTEFCKRLQQKGASLKLAIGWMEERLAEEGTTTEQMILLENQTQAANQLSVGNCVSSLRFLDGMDWRDFVETLSSVEQILRKDPADVYKLGDFSTRDACRHGVERVSRHSALTESEVASLAIQLANRHAQFGGRKAHVGYYLLDRGLAELEREAGMKVPLVFVLPRLARKYPLMAYLVGVGAATGLFTAWLIELALSSNPSFWVLVLVAAFGLVCASQLALTIINWISTVLVKPRLLPRFDFSGGIPAEHRTMVAIPTMLTSLRGVDSLLEALEVRYLANRDSNVYFALLTDLCDAPEEHLPGDAALIGRARDGVERLNAKYREDRPRIFFLLHRPRRWNELDRLWMGHERKRGKLADFNRLLRGGAEDSFLEVGHEASALPYIKYVITLDTDTQLPRDAAKKLVGAMAHPLNRPLYDEAVGRVTDGYSILQPRVVVSLPSASRSRFARLFSGEPGIDPYTRAVSDVYQDLFQEGSFIGKGIYDVDAFERSVGGRFPENRILSHDLLEGSYARSGLITDVQLFEEFPAFYTADTRRRHRWMRGDWQIATWLLPRVPGADARRVVNPIGGLSRWKIFDNLRRSIAPVALVGLLILGWTALPQTALEWSLLLVLIIFLPGSLSLLMEAAIKADELPLRLHLINLRASATRHVGQAFFTLMFLPFDACISLDATARTFGRLVFTRRNLLEWQTASETENCAGKDLRSFWATMWSAPGLAVSIALLLYAADRSSWSAALPILLLWTLCPLAAWWLSLPLEENRAALSEGQIRPLRRLARKTWRYFEAFVDGQENWLPPDNYQETPHPAVATRTSPTNIGMALLANLSAVDFGFQSVKRMVFRLRSTLNTMDGMERYRGHFFNWYATRTLQPLEPLYVSTVDNGNLAGLLLTLRAGLLELAEKPWATRSATSGIHDTLLLFKEAVLIANPSDATDILTRLEPLEAWLNNPPPSMRDAHRLLEEAATVVDSLPRVIATDASGDYAWWRNALEELCREQLEDLRSSFPWLNIRFLPGVLAGNNPLVAQVRALHAQLDWPVEIRGIQKAIDRVDGCLEEARDSSSHGLLVAHLIALRKALIGGLEEAGRRAMELKALADRCDDFARMDFSLLYDSSRKLFAIGYNVTHHRLDASFYDLLASEARLTSFVAIALGQVPQEHWFALGRLLTAVDNSRALISWSGSMFEYLMPALIMPSYEQTLLDASCRAVVKRQIDYGSERGIPWGISESGYFLTDAQSNYQYRAFGVPGLGFKRGLSEDLVIAPYATVIALLVAPGEAVANLDRLRSEGAEGQYGFYEALDYTPSRLQRDQKRAVLRSFMAHHQGMSLLALAYQLLDRPMQRRFQANAFFRAAELLLQERVPRETAVLFPHELEGGRTRESNAETEAPFRVLTNPSVGAPEVNLLSNGRYHVMITSAGGGYSLWNDTALTRWREDPTRDSWGAFIYLRDLDNGRLWSAAHQPVLRQGTSYEAVFSQGLVEFRTRFDEIDSHLEIGVSSEDDVEVRRMAVTNRSAEARSIEVTSFAEVALNTVGADQSHAAFSKLFVETEIISGRCAIVCSRRARSKGEQPPWMFHLLLIQGDEIGEASFESDRSLFLGRGRTAATAVAMEGPARLSNADGPVLDPAVSIRRAVRLAPKASASFTLITGAAPTREAIISLIDKYQDQSLADRVFELARTHALVTLRHLNATEHQAQLFGRLASSVLYSHSSRRADASTLMQNRRGQRNLWSFGISGDLPIVLLRTTTVERFNFVREILQAHAYWRMKGLAVDLVILNEDNSVYRQSVHDQTMAVINSSIEAHRLDKPGGIFVRRADQLSHEDLVLLQASARIVLSDEHGTLSEQLLRGSRPDPLPPVLVPAKVRAPSLTEVPPPQRALMFCNGLGGFTLDGREYVITLPPGQTTPAPWVNVIANPGFGTVVSESGSAYTWSENSHEFRLTPWNNDPVSDTSGEAFYIRDEQSSKYWSPTPLPARCPGPCVVRHGFGYSVFEQNHEGIDSELWMFVAVDAPVKFARLILRNQSGRERSLSVTGYWEWVLGELRQKNLLHVITERDPRTGAVLARNSYNMDFNGRVVFAVVGETARSYTGDRAEFIGRNGSLEHPAALGRVRLSNRVGAGLDPCAALQVGLTLAPGEEREIIFRVGAGTSRDHVQQLLDMFSSRGSCHEELGRVHAHWNNALGAVHVETPDPALNFLVNGWLLYQTMSCRLWARTGFYQSGGAFGFRDQLQDAMALVHARPDLLRKQLLLAAAHQFHEGDVQHWWHPPLNRGVRTHFSDDYLWLPYAACRYVESIGDTGVWDERVAFLAGRAVRPDEESYYDTHEPGGEPASFYEHCVRAIRRGLRFGDHGLPLIGCGDWNDGMNLIGEHGKGESIWLGFLLYDLLTHFSPLAVRRGDTDFGEECLREARRLRENLENHGWDGQWYRRAYFDDGEPLGPAANEECQIDSIPQSWAILAGVSDPKRSRAAMDAVSHRLVRHEARLIQLFDPPFDKSRLDPGYIKGYLPGVRENGGQYTHAAVWTVMAFAKMGDVRRAWEMFDLINPIRHADTAEGIARYKVEPYVVAADVYSVAPHTGRGGWTWYTGSAGWLYRLAAETLLGIKLDVDKLRFAPCLPTSWRSLKVHYRYRGTFYHISLHNTAGSWDGPQRVVLDGVERPDAFVPLHEDHQEHHAEIRFF